MFRIFLTNLGKYNEGELVGEWVDLPVDDDFEQAFEDIGINDQYEEWFITDYENDYGYRVSEYENIYELNEMAEQLDSLTDYEADVIKGYMSEVNDDFEEALQVVEDGDFTYFSGCSDMTDCAYYWVDEICGGVDQLGEDTIEEYFDYEAYGRDIRLGGDLEWLSGEPVDEPVEPDRADFEDEDGFDDVLYDDAMEDYERDLEEYEEYQERLDEWYNMSDYEIGVTVVDDYLGGISEVSNPDYYFDYEAFGNAMSFDGNFVFLDNGDCVCFY